jgi:hypothetical protein
MLGEIVTVASWLGALVLLAAWISPRACRYLSKKQTPKTR